MRHGAVGSSGRRSRNRNNGGGGGNPGNNGGGGQRRGGGNGTPNRMQVMDSNGPEVRIRGTAYQICEKYIALAKDAASSGDRVLQESYLQHAEHYQRIINSFVVETFHSDAPVDARTSPEVPVAGAASDEDLGLPASIIGGRPVAEKSKSELETV